MSANFFGLEVGLRGKVRPEDHLEFGDVMPNPGRGELPPGGGESVGVHGGSDMGGLGTMNQDQIRDVKDVNPPENVKPPVVETPMPKTEFTDEESIQTNDGFRMEVVFDVGDIERLRDISNTLLKMREEQVSFTYRFVRRGSVGGG